MSNQKGSLLLIFACLGFGSVLFYLILCLRCIFRLMHSFIALNIAFEILLLGYFAVCHPMLFVDKAEEPDKPVSPLAAEDTEAEYQRILGLAARRLYRNPNLALEGFARKCGISPPTRGA